MVDVDKIVHELLEVERIKADVVNLVGVFKNRKQLGEILFNNKDLMDSYNKLIYKEIEFVIDRMISSAQSGGVDVVIDWALLPWSKYFAMCHEKHLIKKNKEGRWQSVLKRDDITEDYFNLRDKFSIDYNEKDFTSVIEIEFKNKGFFAGSFDPFTMGHLDIVKQSAKNFDSIVVGIAINEDKNRKFDANKMRDAILKTAKDNNLENFDCVVYSNFTGAKALEMECYTLIRGLRNEEDKLYEQRIGGWNRQHFGLGTVYYYSPKNLKGVSSSRVKQLLDKGVSVENLVPKPVYELIKRTQK